MQKTIRLQISVVILVMMLQVNALADNVVEQLFVLYPSSINSLREKLIIYDKEQYKLPPDAMSRLCAAQNMPFNKKQVSFDVLGQYDTINAIRIFENNALTAGEANFLRSKWIGSIMFDRKTLNRINNLEQNAQEK